SRSPSRASVGGGGMRLFGSRVQVRTRRGGDPRRSRARRADHAGVLALRPDPLRDPGRGVAMPATIARPAVRTTRAQRKAAAAQARRRAGRRRAQAAAVGLVAGYLLDAALGDPRKFHPVAGYGKA